MFSNKLKELRINSGMKRSDLAKKIGVSVSTISNYENGIRKPDSDEKWRILASTFNVTVDYLMDCETLSFPTNIIPFETKKIPLLGDIACGEPIECNQEYDLYINVAANLNADFCVRAKGDSMINARIFDGDLVICKKQPTVENGEIAVVIIDNEATLKRFYKHENSIELRPENPLHKPINFSGVEQESVRILGKAVAFQSLVR